MSRLEILLVFVLHFQETISREIRPSYRYQKAGQDINLPCGKVSSSDPTCSEVSWLHSNDETIHDSVDVKNGKVEQSSPQAARIRLLPDCSLLISNIIAEDYGSFTCRWGVTENSRDVTLAYLSVLTISTSPPDADPQRDGEVTLRCSLVRLSELPSCEPNSLQWVDEKVDVLLDEGDGYKFERQDNCVSVLTVKRQSGKDKKYTCRFFDKGKIEIQADYTPVFTGTSKPNLKDSPHFPAYIIIGALVGVVVLLAVIAVVVIKWRTTAKVNHNVPKLTKQPDEPDVNLTYVTVNHANQQVSATKRVKKEEEVTYSTVKTPVKEEADPSGFYSYVTRPK